MAKRRNESRTIGVNKTKRARNPVGSSLKGFWGLLPLLRQLLVRGREAHLKGSFDRTQSRAFAQIRGYGVVPKGLLTFPDSLYKEVAKTTSRTLVYHFERQTARKNISSFEKHCVLDLECRILSQEPSDSCIL